MIDSDVAFLPNYNNMDLSQDHCWIKPVLTLILTSPPPFLTLDFRQGRVCD